MAEIMTLVPVGKSTLLYLNVRNMEQFCDIYSILGDSIVY